MVQKVSDEEIVEALATVLATHPSWQEPRRLNVFALSSEDALAATQQAYGEDSRALTILFRVDVLAALRATSGKQGFWVSGADGQEFFIETAEEAEALRMFKMQAGAAAASCVGTDLVAAELVRMDAAISGEDPSHLVSKAFLAKIAEGEKPFDNPALE